MEITKGLLFHWWHYYGSLTYTLQEFDQFNEIIDKFGEEKVFDFITASYMTSDGKNTILLLSIRKNVVNELFAALPDSSKMNSDARAEWDKTQKFLFEHFCKTYTPS